MAEDNRVVPPAHAEESTASSESLPETKSVAYVPSVDDHPFAIPGYEVLEKLGQGGMGVVYRVRHLKLARFAAVKLIPAADQARPEALARFFTEAQVIANTRHPNIVEVFDYGEVDGSPYLVMELLAHGSLSDRLRAAGQIDVGERLGLLKKVVRAVAAVHAKGVVHRDLKPGNVLFNEVGEPKVTDFGLAKRADSELTGTHAVMGTVPYMSPEQAQGHAKAIGPPSDVWSLGVILYECLTGKRPFPADSSFAVMTRIVGDEPIPPRQLNADLPPALAEVIAKCLRKNANERFPSAVELAAALDRVRPESVTPASAPDRMPPAKSSRGRFVVPAVVLALLAAGGVAVSQWPAREANPSAVAEGSLSAPTPPEVDAEQTPQPGRQPVSNVPGEKIPETLAPKLRPAGDYWTAATRAKAMTLTGHAAKVTFVQFSPDGSRVVTASEDKTAKVWDATTGAVVLTLKGHTFGVFTAAFSPDGTRIVTTSNDGSARMWDAKTGTEVPGFRHAGGGSVYAALFNSDGSRIAAAVTSDYAAQVWTAATGRELVTFKGHERAVGFAAFSPDDTRVVTASDDKTAKVWDAKTGAELFTFKGHTDWVKTALFSPDGTRIVSASWDRTAKVWDAKTGAELLTLRASEGIVHSAAYSPDGSRIVTAGGDYLARVWDATTGAALLTLEGHGRTVFSAAFSPDGSRIVTAGDDNTAKIWTAR